MKVIVFRFFGGARDGEAVRSDQPQGIENEAKVLWKLTWEGTIGRRFDVSEPSTRAYDRYQVKSKYEIDDEVHVTCEHVG
jgi:hypothetical protein